MVESGTHGALSSTLVIRRLQQEGTSTLLHATSLDYFFLCHASLVSLLLAVILCRVGCGVVAHEEKTV